MKLYNTTYSYKLQVVSIISLNTRLRLKTGTCVTQAG